MYLVFYLDRPVHCIVSCFLDNIKDLSNQLYYLTSFLNNGKCKEEDY